MKLVTSLALVALIGFGAASYASATVVFSTDFQSGLPAEFSAPGCTVEGVQGYSGLGPAGRQFGGNLLRYSAVTLFPTKLKVRNLPPHDHLSLKHLLAIIDSWDSTEILQISVDGALLFSHRWSLALADTTTYFPAPPGAILRMGTNLGWSFGGYYIHDRAYDLGVEPVFLDIPHTADSVEVVWSMSAVSGPAASQWQGGGDESWGMDAVSIEVTTQNVGVGDRLGPGALAVAAFPNPVRRGALALRVSLPASEPARLELLDLAGRRVAGRDLEDFGAGAHTIRLDEARTLVPGLYFARVRQGARSSTARVVVAD